MAQGLLGGVLPTIFSKADELKRGVYGLLSDPMEQARRAGQSLLQSRADRQALMGQAFANPERPFQVTNYDAMAQLGNDVLMGELGIAPVGMVGGDVYKMLQEANKTTFPKIPVENIFPNPKGKLPQGKINSFDDIIEREIELPFKEIDVNSIVPTQKIVNFDNLKKVKNVKDAKDSILAVEHEGMYYLIDGHHRVANSILENKDKINVRVLE
jgi:hypothetical protein